ncbi:MAG: hypothetical protein ACOY3I_05070 [Verrucomicrobiota bacterium]
MPDPIPPIRSEPPKPKPVPVNAAKPKEEEPSQGKLLPSRLKIKKIEPNQPRQRKTPVVQLPKPEYQPSRFSSFGLQIKNFGRDNLVKATIAILIISGIVLFFLLRETRLQVAIDSGTLQLQTEAHVVLDFSERITMVQRSLEERLEPLRQALEEAEASLGAAQADFAGRSQSKKLLTDTLDQDEKKMSGLIHSTRGELNNLWDVEFKKLDDEQEKTKIALNNKIKDRAKELKIALNLSSDLDAPEVIVNAFRLALYGAPKEVDVNAQRTWVESLLQEWKQMETKLSEKRADLRAQVQKVREPLGGQIDDIQKRMARMREEIVGIDENLNLIQAEINRFEDRVSTLKKEMQDTLQPFYEDLLGVPKDYIRFTYSIVNGSLDVREIEKNAEFKPGNYRLLVRATRDGEEYWCLQNFEIRAYKTTLFNITPDQFVSVRSLLESP